VRHNPDWVRGTLFRLCFGFYCIMRRRRITAHGSYMPISVCPQKACVKTLNARHVYEPPKTSGETYLIAVQQLIAERRTQRGNFFGAIFHDEDALAVIESQSRERPDTLHIEFEIRFFADKGGEHGRYG
jgi:hypothetical protein